MSTRLGKFLGAFLLLLMALVGCSRQPGGGPAYATYEKAYAAYERKEYERAEALALKAAAQARRYRPVDRGMIIQCVECAGLAAIAESNTHRAMIHLAEAASLTDKARDPTEWCRIETTFAYFLYEQGNFLEAERRYRELIAVQTEKLGTEDPEVLLNRFRLGRILFNLRKYSEAEAEYRAILELPSVLRNPELGDALNARSGLASVLSDQWKFLEAEAEYRAVLQARKRLYGAEHPDTLSSRRGVAVTLLRQGKLLEAEEEYRALLPLHERILGREHPDTLKCLYDLAFTLKRQYSLDEASALALRAVEGGRKIYRQGDSRLKDYEQLYVDLTAKK
jgi:hypothetical protein